MLYHMVPPAVCGDRLHPLSELRVIEPDLFKEYVKRYEGREFVMQISLPHLQCLWNEVIHLSPVHPHAIKEALEGAGFEWYQTSYYVIDPLLHGIDETNAVIHRSYWAVREEVPVIESRCTPFNQAELPTLSRPSNAVRHGYLRAKMEGTLPFLYVFVPHVLFKGSLPISALPIITV